MSNQLPFAHNDEQALVSCALSGDAAIASAIITSTPNGSITASQDLIDLWSVAKDLVNNSEQINQQTIRLTWDRIHKHKKFPFPLFATFQDVLPNHWQQHQAVVIDTHRRRKLIYALQDILHKAANRDHSIEQLIADAERSFDNETITAPPVLDPKQAAHAFTNDLEQRWALKGKLSGIATGFINLDTAIDGLQRAEMTIIAARPSIGKTAIGLNIATHATFQDKIPTLFITLEMRPENLCRRICSARMSISMQSLRSGQMDKREIDYATNFNADLSRAPLYFLNGIRGLSASQLCSSARRLIRKHEIQLVVVDYLQRIKPDSKHEKRTYEVADVSSQLKGLADSTGVAMLALAQLSRENEKDKGRIPRLGDLADSAQIERDADTVLLLHRDRTEAVGDATIIIGKQRDGACDMIGLQFRGEFCRFENKAWHERD